MLLELSDVGPPDEPLRLCCHPEGWRLFRTMVRDVTPLERLLHIESVDQATANP